MNENNYKKAIAIKYSSNSGKPITKAETSEVIADRIIKDVFDGNNPIYKDIELIKRLSKEDFTGGVQDDVLPVALEIISFINRIDEKYLTKQKNN